MPDESPSSQNALTHGLFAARDFIRKGEELEYAEILQSVTAQLEPDGIIEQTFAAEIVGATWRLRRCRMVEQSLSQDAALDPMMDESLYKQQKSVDRARAQSHNILRRSLAELRKLQAERAAREQAAEYRKRDDRELMESLLEQLAEDSDADDPVGQISDLPTEIPFCNSAEPTPRNAPCPCGSGVKYKRCCGQGAPPVLNKAA